jgi:DNA-directed RNA polymerase subunit RPC12/RpoP
MAPKTAVRICLDCGRDDLAREGEPVARCPDCDSPAIR